MTEKDTAAEYAVWNVPGTGIDVKYSLALFHDIDFVANEGYRRIPHGGLEVGGLLFGHFEGNSVRIDAFRSIECEHSSGPSFMLSERDLIRLREQIDKFREDSELQDLELVGWFISHSRTELLMNDREVDLFDRFFAERGAVTLLVKPERFKPTRFALLTRLPDGQVTRNGAEHAFILPLPGRAGGEKRREPVPSIAMPSPPVSGADDRIPSSAVTEPKTPSTIAELRPQESGFSKQSAPPKREEFIPSALNRAEEETQLMPRELVLPAALYPPAVGKSVPSEKSAAPQNTAPPDKPVRQPQEPAPERSAPAEARSEPASPRAILLPEKSGKTKSKALVASAVLAIFALLGVAAGYALYFRLMPSSIPLSVEDHSPSLFVSWPAQDTIDSNYVVIRINDGDPQPLTPEEKASGQAEVKQEGTDVKIELIAKHWLHDSHGIVRYLRRPTLEQKAPPVQAPSSAMAQQPQSTGQQTAPDQQTTSAQQSSEQ